MANQKLYEPARRFDHVSFSLKGKVYLWGGVIQDLSSGYRDELARRFEQFDPYLEIWSPLNTAGTPHPGLRCAACASHGEHVYMYGGRGTKHEGVLSCLNFGIKTPTWSQLSTAETVGGPMRKALCSMVHFHNNKLAVIGGYGYPNGPIQPGSVFIEATSGNPGWTNEIHIFDINLGVWISPVIRGTRPPPCFASTLTSVDNHQAVLFGGRHPERCRTNDLYLIDFDTMCFSKVEPREGEPWPAERSGHAVCCLGYAGDHIHLLVTGGLDRHNKPLNNAWLFNLSLKEWNEVTIPDSDNVILPIRSHSTTAHILCPGLIEVIKFGGSPDDLHPRRPSNDYTRIAETTVITFRQIGSEWEVVGVANNSQRGTSERVRDKVLKMSEVARAAIDNGAERQPDRETSQADKRALEGRVEEAEAAVREERARARDAENRAELAERAVMEERQRTQEAERQPDRETSQADKRASVIHFTCKNDNDSRNKTSTDAWNLCGVEVCGEMTVVVYSSHGQQITWPGYGLRLNIPKGCLPAGMEQCTINIKASLAGQYEFPENSHLVSAIFWLRCEDVRKFTEPIIVEIQHCTMSENIINLSFVQAVCSQKQLPYTFKQLPGGNFTSHSSYGVIELNSFSGVGVTQEGSTAERHYYSKLFYLSNYCLGGHRIDFTVMWNTEAHINEVKKYYNGEGAHPGPDQPLEFEGEEIRLDLPMEETKISDKWSIVPLIDPMITKSEVDSYLPGTRLPHCELEAHPIEGQFVTRLVHKLVLLGAKPPRNKFILSYMPPAVPQASAAEAALKPHTKEELGSKSATPELKVLLRVLRRVAGEWEDIGIELDIEEGLLRQIKADNAGECKACLREMLRAWLSCVAPPPTWSAMADALDTLGHQDIATQLRTSQN